MRLRVRHSPSEYIRHILDEVTIRGAGHHYWIMRRFIEIRRPRNHSLGVLGQVFADYPQPKPSPEHSPRLHGRLRRLVMEPRFP
jgi:hypothetical protein